MENGAPIFLFSPNFMVHSKNMITYPGPYQRIVHTSVDCLVGYCYIISATVYLGCLQLTSQWLSWLNIFVDVHLCGCWPFLTYTERNLCSERTSPKQRQIHGVGYDKLKLLGAATPLVGTVIRSIVSLGDFSDASLIANKLARTLPLLEWHVSFWFRSINCPPFDPI